MLHRSHLIAAARQLAPLALAAASVVAPVHAESLLGLTTTNQLVWFDSSMPMHGTAPVSVMGLGTQERLLGIDWRPSTGMLYGVSSAGRLYTVNAYSGAATWVADLAADPADASAPFAGLKSPAIGIDFNPVPDLGQTLPSLRVTSAAGENLRINVNGASAGRVTTDADLNGPAMPSIVASAYTNSDTDPATGTMLYGIDEGSDMLYLQSPPNNGTLVAVGALGVDTIGVTGFDISGVTGQAYASLTDGFTGKSGLYALSLGTGAATWMGDFGIGGNTAVMPPLLGLTVAAVPEPETYAMLAAGLAVVAGVVRRRRQRA